jgi:hypothetical protein
MRWPLSIARNTDSPGCRAAIDAYTFTLRTPPPACQDTATTTNAASVCEPLDVSFTTRPTLFNPQRADPRAAS